MSPSPVSPSDTKGVDQYSAAWQAIMQLARQGSSWSGHERNCCYLNTGGKFTGGKFANVSHVSGLDFPDDGRALAVTDWDLDGDLDLWFRNRTAPRLRLMLNRSSHRPEDHAGNFVALRLEGTTANRDAIGAVVELTLKGSNQRLIRSVRAGDLFLSQSSKWLHFGFPDSAEIESVTVLWPGGEQVAVAGIESGRRYLIEEGAPAAKAWQPAAADRTIALASSDLPTSASSTGVAAIVLPAPVPLPRIRYVDANEKAAVLDPGKTARLLILWSAGCPHCLAEIGELAKHYASLKQAGLDFLALCVDGPGSDAVGEAKAFIARTGFAGPWGMIDSGDLERIQAVQEALFDKTPAFAVPLSLLLNPNTDAVAIYRGPLSMETLQHDLRTAVNASDATLRSLAPPFPGRWYTTPASPAYIPEMIARRIQAKYPEDALPYLHLAADRSSGGKKKDLVAELGRKHYSLARKFATDRRADAAEFHFRQSLDADPLAAGVHNDFGTMLAQLGRLEEGASHFAEAVRLKPDYPLAQKNLARARELLGGKGKGGAPNP